MSNPMFEQPTNFNPLMGRTGAHRSPDTSGLFRTHGSHGAHGAHGALAPITPIGGVTDAAPAAVAPTPVAPTLIDLPLGPSEEAPRYPTRASLRRTTAKPTSAAQQAGTAQPLGFAQPTLFEFESSPTPIRDAVELEPLPTCPTPVNAAIVRGTTIVVPTLVVAPLPAPVAASSAIPERRAVSPEPVAAPVPMPIPAPMPAVPVTRAPASNVATTFDRPVISSRVVAPVDTHTKPYPTVVPEPKPTAVPPLDPDLRLALQHLVDVGGSDLHIAGDAAPLVRVDGVLAPIDGSAVLSGQRVTTLLRSILSPSQLEEFDTHLELDLAITLSPTARFRVNLYQQRGMTGGAFRLIPTLIKQLAELGVPESIARFAGLPRGLVLVTGPTGSGKSTTLAALVDLVNRTRADHIVTVEDPIEFLHSNKKSLVSQREVGGDTRSFAAALKHVLRQDPDVILIGELRDLETIAVALTAAETGHLVFATLHTQDAAQSIDRMIDVFPPHQQAQVRSQLAATLQGVVSQTLVRRADGEGRVVATEVLVVTPAIANLIREGKTHQVTSAMQTGRELGMHTLDQRLADLVAVGAITHTAALEKARDAAGLRQLIYRDAPAGAGPDIAAGGVDFGDSFDKSEARR